MKGGAFGSSVWLLTLCATVVVVSAHVSLSRSFAIEATKVPSLGDSITEGTIVKFEKSQ